MIKDAIKTLDHAVRRKGGIKPEFGRYHVYLALELLVEGRPIGRKSLSKVLGIGEGSVRTLIRRLRELGLISVDPVAGVLITSLGVKLVEAVRSRLEIIGYADVDECSICGNCRIAAVLLRDGINDVRRTGVLRIRDLIVKKGSDGGLIVFYINSEFRLPNSKELYRLERSEPLDSLLRERNIVLKDGDCILISMCRRGDVKCLMYVVETVFEVFSD